MSSSPLVLLSSRFVSSRPVVSAQVLRSSSYLLLSTKNFMAGNDRPVCRLEIRTAHIQLGSLSNSTESNTLKPDDDGQQHDASERCRTKDERIHHESQQGKELKTATRRLGLGRGGKTRQQREDLRPSGRAAEAAKIESLPWSVRGFDRPE